MANNFDQFPIYDPVIKMDSGKLSPLWANYLSEFYQNIIAYLTQGGFLLPELTTEQRNALQNVRRGQMIYNTTLDTAQYFKAGSWVSF